MKLTNTNILSKKMNSMPVDIEKSCRRFKAIKLARFEDFRSLEETLETPVLELSISHRDVCQTKQKKKVFTVFI